MRAVQGQEAGRRQSKTFPESAAPSLWAEGPHLTEEVGRYPKDGTLSKRKNSKVTNTPTEHSAEGCECASAPQEPHVINEGCRQPGGAGPCAG